MNDVNNMSEMLKSFERKKSEGGIGLENTALFKYFESGESRSDLIIWANNLCQTTDIDTIVKEIRKMLSQKPRFHYGFVHSEAYSKLNVDFADRFKTGKNKKEQLISVLKNGHSKITATELYSFLKDKISLLLDAVRNAAIIAIACDAASHRRTKYQSGRINRIHKANANIDSGVVPLDQKTVELLMERLRHADPDAYDKRLLIKIDSSRFTSVSFVIVGDSWVIEKNKSKCQNDATDKGVDLKARFHYAVLEYDPELEVTISCPDSNDYEKALLKYNEWLEGSLSEFLENHDNLQKIDTKDLEVFSSILRKADENVNTIRAVSTGTDDTASFIESC